MSICSSVEDIRRRGVESQRAQKPLVATADVLYYARGLKAKTLTAAEVPERLRNAVQEYLMTLWQQKEKQ